MNSRLSARRWTAGLVLAALTVTSFAPAAEASHARWRRYKGGDWCPPPRHYTQRVIVERHSDAGPAIAGFLGGLIVGAVLSNANDHAVAPAQYYYEDPYCHDRFGSLDLYMDHVRYSHHPRVVRVIDVRSGYCVHTWQWRDGGWCERDGNDWNDGNGDDGDWDN